MKKKRLAWQQKMFIITLSLMFVFYMIFLIVENFKSYWNELELLQPYINTSIGVVEAILFIVLIISVGLLKFNGYEFTADVSIENASQEFKDAFNKVFDKHNKILKKIKGNLSIIEILTWIFLVLFCCSYGIASLMSNIKDLNAFFIIGTMILLIIIPAILIEIRKRKLKRYVQYFKENCMRDFFDNLHINHSNSASEEDISKLVGAYNKAKCSTSDAKTAIVDEFILKNIENKEIYFAEVDFQRIDEASLYKGLFSYIRLENNINSRIKITTEEVYEYETIKTVNLDSSEFEKIYDVYAEDPILAVRILTSDIMELMVEFYNKHSIAFELNITDDMLAIKFYTGKMFEPSIVGNALNIEVFYAYYVIMEFAEETIKRFNKVFNEFDS